MNFRYDSDMASDLKDQKDFNQDYDYSEEKGEHYHLEIIKLHKDDDNYKKKKGVYVSIQFDDIEQNVCFEEVQTKLKEVLQGLSPKKINRILICGLGNSDLACDRLGPLLKNKIIINEIGHVYLLIPGVKGQTGIETYDLIQSYAKECQPDLVLLVDALATRSIERMNHVIQLTDSGLRPGSGIGNDCLELSKETLGVPVLSLGVPTVVRLVNIALDMLNYLKIDQTNVLEDKIENSHFNQIVMDKGCDYKIEKLSRLIAGAINQFIDESLL